ncbi:MAG TPA: hypothetical protein VFI24_08430 [Pyrinomonadaceae bacterium]|nr:hypothetical protein [Pyrinomonadaceae bacterium]
MKDTKQYAEPLMELLTAQCADLEALLLLARRENVAANEGNFEELFSIAGERASFSQRLESYHTQVSELRSRLGDNSLNSAPAREAIRLAVEIQSQDAQTKSLLLTARTRLNESHRNSTAYLKHSFATGRNYNQSC